jgi:hypothetical protein
MAVLPLIQSYLLLLLIQSCLALTNYPFQMELDQPLRIEHARQIELWRHHQVESQLQQIGDHTKLPISHCVTQFR